MLLFDDWGLNPMFLYGTHLRKTTNRAAQDNIISIGLYWILNSLLVLYMTLLVL